LRNDSAVGALYTQATHAYLDRDFAGAFNTIRIALKQPQGKDARKLWLLYMAVLDSSCSLDEARRKEQFGKEASNVLAKLQEGTLWDETQAQFDKTPFEVMAPLIMSSIRHMKDPARLQRRVEDYLSSLEPDTSAYEKTMELYALHVLPKCKEWDYALEFIASSEMSQERKDAWTRSIGEIQDAEAAAFQRAAAKEKAEQEQRAREEKEERRRRRKRKNASGSKSAVSTNTDAPRAAEVDETTKDDTVAASSSSSSSSKAVVPSVSSWRPLLARLNPKLVRMVVLLVVVFGAAGRQRVRERVRRMAASVASTVAAAFKVSYI
jgi:hypothetical protein